MQVNSRTARGGVIAGVLAGALAGVLAWAPGGAQELLSDRDALGAADRVHVADAVLILETEIWAGGGVAAGPGPWPATVVLRVRGDGHAVPAGLRMDGLWYVNGGAVSPGVPLGQTMEAPEGEVMRQAASVVDADGDGLVDVVVGVRDEGGTRHLIKAADQPLLGF